MSSVSSKVVESLEELIQILLKNRGEIDLAHVVLQLSRGNRKVVSDFGAQDFVNKFPQLFQTRRTKSKVMLRLDVPLEFCPQAGDKGGCTDRGCLGLHLCPFFVKETCKFGDKCKRSHEYRDEHTMRVLRHFRLGFLDLNLLQEILKIIVDKSEIQRAAAGRSSPDICKFYNKSVCKKEENCPCLHVCEHFVDGDCKFGGRCKRNHDFSDSHNRRVLEEYDMEHIGNLRVLQRLRGRERKRTFSASSDEDSVPSLRCQPMRINSADTTLPHTSVQQGIGGRSIPDICKFYNKANCTKGDACPNLHVCEHFISANCKFGERCKRDHSFSSSHNRRVLKQHGVANVDDVKVLVCLQARVKKRIGNTSSNVENPLTVNGSAVNPSQDDKDKDTEICGFHMRGKCNYGDNCIHHHTNLPYLWQFAAQGDNQWESFSDGENTILEHCYCDVNNEHSTHVTINGSLYFVNFQDMSAVPVTFPGATARMLTFMVKMLRTTESVVKVRRLSTVSSVVAAAGHLFCTRWEWFWKDENNKWQSYDTPGDGHVVNTTSSECLERDYQAGKDTHPFGASHHQYTLNFKRWCQKNDKFKTERPVRRRPAEFVSKQNMTDIIAQRRKAAGMARPTGASSTETNGVPSHWSSIPFGEEYSCESLSSISVEYKNTEKRFQDSMDKSHKIVSIQRVQNPDLWIQYKQKKDRMAKKSGKEPEERQLFHGTNPNTVKAICQQGFDWRMCGKNGTAYGKGSYFASNANYSHCYSNHGVSRGNKQMFLAKVLVGSFTNGDKSFKRPPPKDSSNPNVLYDSCCNDTTNPALFVVFENGQSYPEFLITYT